MSREKEWWALCNEFHGIDIRIRSFSTVRHSRSQAGETGKTPDRALSLSWERGVPWEFGAEFEHCWRLLVWWWCDHMCWGSGNWYPLFRNVDREMDRNQIHRRFTTLFKFSKTLEIDHSSSIFQTDWMEFTMFSIDWFLWYWIMPTWNNGFGRVFDWSQELKCIFSSISPELIAILSRQSTFNSQWLVEPLEMHCCISVHIIPRYVDINRFLNLASWIPFCLVR
jgi:hypothetical protein